MKPGEFLNQVDDSAIVAAIRRAESLNSGEIRVFVSNREAPDPVAIAWGHFFRLKMDQTKERNGVLIFVAPVSRTFAVIGDKGIQSRCGDTFWAAVAAHLEYSFKQSALTEGIVGAIDRAGRMLAEHFPRKADDVNELPDQIQRD